MLLVNKFTPRRLIDEYCGERVTLTGLEEGTDYGGPCYKRKGVVHY